MLQTNPVPFDIIGFPEIAFPIGFQPHAASGREVPIGAIIGGRPYQEDRLLALVGAYQTATDWHLRRPADPAPVTPAARAAKRPRLTAEDVEELTSSPPAAPSLAQTRRPLAKPSSRVARRRCH